MAFKRSPVQFRRHENDGCLWRAAVFVSKDCEVDGIESVRFVAQFSDECQERLDRQAIALEPGDDAPVAEAIFPEIAQALAFQRLADAPGVVESGDALGRELAYSGLDLRVSCFRSRSTPEEYSSLHAIGKKLGMGKGLYFADVGEAGGVRSRAMRRERSSNCLGSRIAIRQTF